MPLSDVLAAALSRPVGRVVEGPVRAILHEVLKDHGYASPAEVHALREEIAAAARRVDALEGLAREAMAQAESLEGKLAELAASRVAPSDSTPGRVVVAAPCAVEACGAPALRGALCPAHHQAWLAGSLPGFVGPEGLIELGGAPYRLPQALAGKPFALGEMPGSVVIDGGEILAVGL